MKKKVLVIAIIAMLIIMLVVLTGCGNEIKNEPVSSSNQISSNENQTKVQEQTQKLSNEDIIYKYEEYRKELNTEKIADLFNDEALYKYVKDGFDFYYRNSLTYDDDKQKLDNMQKNEIKQKLTNFYNTIFKEYIKDKAYEIHSIEKVISGEEFEKKLKDLGYFMSQEQVDETQRELSNYDIYIAVVTENGVDTELNYFYFDKNGELADIGIRCIRGSVAFESLIGQK